MQKIIVDTSRKTLNSIVYDYSIVDTGNCYALMALLHPIKINLGIIELYDPVNNIVVVEDKGVFALMDNRRWNNLVNYNVKIGEIVYNFI